METERRKAARSNRGDPMGRVSLWGVRAFIVAEKRRNGRGAKGGRKVDA